MHRALNFCRMPLLLCLYCLLSAAKCQKKEMPNSVQPQGDLSKNGASQLAGRGKIVYEANCITCHSRNPKTSGPLGPDVYGSSKELLTARVVYGNYPEGYKPKRESHLMRALPHLQPEINALYEYLNN